MSEIRKENDPKLHLGVSGPRAPKGHRAQPNVTDEIRRGNDPKLHLGVTGPRVGPGPNLKSRPYMESGRG
eukprot:7634166-Karenia_brevis.AAC.1